MRNTGNQDTRLHQVLRLSISQAEVDFVIPDLANDLPLCIDPFLMFKSRDAALREYHNRLLSLFNQGIQLFRDGKRADLARLIDFPEVNEIGFGYSEGQIRGSGLGEQINGLLADLLTECEPLQDRGLRHIEELQLISIGVGADRVSDIAANILKQYLVEYTQRQAKIWAIPLSSTMPVCHSFDFDSWDWVDGYHDLPRNPLSGAPILLVPRRMVRLLPWINYPDYLSNDFRLFLGPRSRSPRYPGMTSEKKVAVSKDEVVRVTRERLHLLDQYVARKEREASDATPALGADRKSEQLETQRGEILLSRLNELLPGGAAAKDYQRLVYEILNYAFEPDLTDGQMEVSTYLGTERRDIIYTNEAEASFWAYVRSQYGSPLVMFEAKNVADLEIDHINQVAAYLGARLGMLGFIITRTKPSENIIRKLFAVFNDTPSMPRKVIIVLCDEDLTTLVRHRQEGKNPARVVQGLYREFRTRVQ
jgi:hypothetical protein